MKIYMVSLLHRATINNRFTGQLVLASTSTEELVDFIMAALWNRTGHYIFAMWFLLLSCFLLFFLA